MTVSPPSEQYSNDKPILSLVGLLGKGGGSLIPVDVLKAGKAAPIINGLHNPAPAYMQISRALDRTFLLALFRVKSRGGG